MPSGSVPAFAGVTHILGVLHCAVVWSMHLFLHEYFAGVGLPTQDAQHVSRGVAHILGVFALCGRFSLCVQAKKKEMW